MWRTRLDALEATSEAVERLRVRVDTARRAATVRSALGAHDRAVDGARRAREDLEDARNALRAWTLTSGYEVTGRAYESYKSGVAAAFTENGQFDVYWPLK